MVGATAREADLKLVRRLLFAAGLIAVLFGKWINFPISNQLRGLRFALLEYSLPHPFLYSYGTLAALLIVMWAIASEQRSARMSCLVGCGLLMLTWGALLQVAFTNPALLKQLADEANQVQRGVYFATAYLPVNIWIEPTRWRFLTFDSVAERLVSGWYFLSFGWYVAVASGVASLCAGLRYPDFRERTRALLIAGSALIGLTAILLLPHLRAKLALNRAVRAESSGQLQEALELYRETIRLDGWNSLNPNIYARIGAIDSALGRTNTVESRIYHAESLAAQDDLRSAIAEYQELALSQPNRLNWMRQREAELWTSYGQDLLASGAIGGAVIAWQNALHSDSRMWLAAFYLSRGYFLTGRYQEAVDFTKRLMDQLSDPVVRADLYCNLGDAYTRLGALNEARIAYRHAWRLDQKLNLRALSSLVGP